MGHEDLRLAVQGLSVGTIAVALPIATAFLAATTVARRLPVARDSSDDERLRAPRRKCDRAGAGRPT
jgi:hypothetical protein